MNRNIVVILVAAVIIGAISLFYNYIKQYTPEYNWGENFKKESVEPYGLSVFYELMDDQPEDLTVIKSNYLKNLDTNAVGSTYIVIGDELYLTEEKAKHLFKYVSNGNTALIVTNVAPLEVTRTMLPISDTIYGYDYVCDSIVDVVFEGEVGEPIRFHHQSLKDTTNYYWNYYYKSFVNDTLSTYNFEPVSYLNDGVNCYSFNQGKGKVILHSNPILFSNYYLINDPGLAHVNSILSQLNQGDIYWDKVSKKPETTSGGGGFSSTNPLQFLFSHYTLRWGWYLFLITVVVYLLFRTKREQRIIPILPTNTNTTIEYTKAIGVLYFQKGQHKLIANELYTLLLADLRSRYNINTSIEEPELIKLVSAKSGINEDDVNNLFKHFRKVRFSPIANSKDLINLHNTVESYYKNCN